MFAELTLGKLCNGFSNVETMWQKGAVGAGIEVELGLAAQTVIIPALGKTKEGRFSFRSVVYAVSSRWTLATPLSSSWESKTKQTANNNNNPSEDAVMVTFYSLGEYTLQAEPEEKLGSLLLDQSSASSPREPGSALAAEGGDLVSGLCFWG